MKKARAPLFCLLLLCVSGARAAEVDVQVTGISGDMRESVLNSMILYRERNSELLDEFRIRTLHRAAPEQIEEALRPFGYYRAEVDAQLQRQDGVWLARYQVRPGPPVRVTSVNLELVGEGAEEEAFRQWRREFPLKPGERLQHQPYEEAKSALQGLARRIGFLDARWLEREIRVSVEELTARIDLRFDTGPRFRFGEVDFPDVPLGEPLLSRFLTFRPGEPFRTEDVLEFQRNLSASDYFNRVEVAPRPEAGGAGRVPVDVRLEMAPRTRYAGGVGYGTDTGARLTLGVQRRWVNARGHRMGAELLFSEVRDTLDLDYRIPLARPTTDSLGFTSEWIQETTETSERTTADIGMEVTRQLGDWLRAVGIIYQSESFTVGGESERSQMLIPGIRWQRVEAANRIFPRRGWRLAIGLNGASEDFLSATDLWQAEAEAKWIVPWGSGRLIAGTQLGVSEVDNFDVLPVSLRFFAGGDTSVRGYAYQSLGPTNEEGEVIGGRNLIVGSIEYDRMLNERWGYALFFDAGNAFNFDAPPLEKGAGLGLRVRLPFGLIRVDVASAITEPGNPWRLHLNIGPGL